MNVGVKEMIDGLPSHLHALSALWRQGSKFTIKLNADPEVKRLGADAGFECDEDPATFAVPKAKISETLCIFVLLSLN